MLTDVTAGFPVPTDWVRLCSELGVSIFMVTCQRCFLPTSRYYFPASGLPAYLPPLFNMSSHTVIYSVLYTLYINVNVYGT